MSADDQTTPPDGRAEKQFADAVTIVVAIVVTFEAIAWAAERAPWALPGMAALIALLVPIRYGRRLAVRHAPAAAARWMGGGLMATTIAYAVIVPEIVAVLTVVPLMVVALLLPHRPPSPIQRRNLLVGAWATSVLITLAAVLIDPSGGTFGFIDGFVLFALANTHALTLLLFGQYDRRVRQNLDRVVQSEARLRAVVGTAADGVLVIDDERRISRANEAASLLFDRPHDTLIGLDIEHVVELDGQTVDASSSLGSHVTRGRAADGATFPAEVSIGPRFGEGERVLVVRDVTERARAAAELARRAEALVRSNRELERFAYVASHDLQEPLRKIQAFGSLLDESARDRLDPEEQQALDYLIDAATRQRALINDLLAYSRARTRPRQVGVVDLNGVMAEVLDDLSPAIAEKAAIIETDPLPTLRADRSQMVQLLRNLLGNALKYASADRRPRITVRCATTSGDIGPTLHLHVADNGIGFEDRFSERIFEPFRRLHPRHTYPGSGVGLAICRQIAERHGGTITAHGQVDVGATFTIELPLERVEGGADGRGRDAPEKGHDSTG